MPTFIRFVLFYAWLALAVIIVFGGSVGRFFAKTWQLLRVVGRHVQNGKSAKLRVGCRLTSTLKSAPVTHHPAFFQFFHVKKKNKSTFLSGA